METGSVEPGFPPSLDEFLNLAQLFRAKLDALRARVQIPDAGWYPYGSLSALPWIAGTLGNDYPAIAETAASEPCADLGCGDGDLAMLLDHLGCPVDAIDHEQTTYNQLRGLKTLHRELGAKVSIHDIDLDQPFQLPRARYGLVALLGTLYHLKNPWYVLDKLAQHAGYCLLSTRIASQTGSPGVAIEDQPVAYLLGAREINDDPTNTWVFSRAGLLRLLDRANWMVRGEAIAGCTAHSNPIDPDADQRIVLLLKSRIRFPELHARPAEGWHAVENGAWRWTKKRFSIQVALPRNQPARQFALRVNVPQPVAAPGVLLSCTCQGEPAGLLTCDETGEIEFRGTFPPRLLPGANVVLDFELRSDFRPAAGDRRELGIIVPVSGGELPFRIS